MPYLETAESWLAQSSLLLKAYPTTTRVTTKYSINPPVKRSKLLRKRLQSTATAATTSAPSPSSSELRTTNPTILVLKTYDPVSGVTLKYKTDKAADVGRLIASLGRLGRHMAALPDTTATTEDTTMGDAGTDDAVEESGGQAQVPVVGEGKAATVAAAAAAVAGKVAGGKKGKKKGKK